MEEKSLSSVEYGKLLVYALGCSCEQLIALCEKYKDYQIHHLNFKEELIGYLIRKDTIDNPNISKGVIEFINSKYVSDYLKKYIINNKYYKIEEVKEILRSNTNILDFDPVTLKLLFDNSFEIKSLVYNSGTTKCNKILEKEDVNDLTNLILRQTIGISKSSYFAGRGVRRSDLNENHLTLILNALRRIKSDKEAKNFIELVFKMPTLGATEFIETFKYFSAVGFDVNKTYIETDNCSLNSARDAQREMVAFCAFMNLVNNKSDGKWATSNIKMGFSDINEKSIKELIPDYDTYIDSVFGEDDIKMLKKMLNN